MRTLRILLSSAFLISFFSCSQAPVKEVKENTGSIENATENASDKIEAYYFHFTARCVTCRTIEANARENLETLYPQQTQMGLITFKAINLDEPENKQLAEKLNVSGQTLLIIKGDQKINLTNEGFLYAVGKPARFKEIINEKVDFLLSR